MWVRVRVKIVARFTLHHTCIVHFIFFFQIYTYIATFTLYVCVCVCVCVCMDKTTLTISTQLYKKSRKPRSPFPKTATIFRTVFCVCVYKS